MSLTSLARSGGPSGATMRVAAVGGGAATTQTPKDLLQALTTFIPGEVLTIYLTAESQIRGKLPAPLKLTTPATPATTDAATTAAVAVPGWASTLDIIAFVLCIIATIGWVVGARYLQDKAAGTQNAQWPWWRVIAGVVAFVVYGLSADTILFNGPNEKPWVTIAVGFALVFITPVLVFLDKLIATKYPQQSATS